MDIFELDGEMVSVGPSDLILGWYEVVDEHDVALSCHPTMKGAVAMAADTLKQFRMFVDMELEEILG